jgi:exonuclease SbcD
MKFIHTADWHLGQNFYQHTRDEEFRHFFDCLLGTLRAERPDALLVAGDIFDNALPGVEAQQFYYDTVVSLHEACPEMQIFIIAGNHDSASRLEAPNRLWRALNVTVIGTLAKQEGAVDYTRHIFPVRHDGETVALVVALPHTYAGNLPHVEAEESADDYSARTLQLLQRLHHVAVERGEGKHLPILLMAHLAAVTTTGGRAWSDGVGGKESLDLTPVAQLYDYVALGHIHNPAPFTGVSNARYAGAPIPISFEETYPHGVIVGEITADGTLQLRREEYPTLIPVERVPKEPAVPEEALAALEAYPADRTAYVQANILMEGQPQPELKERIRRALEGKQARFCDIKYTYPERTTEGTALQVRDMTELRAIDPITMARIYYKEKTDVEMTDAQVALLQQIIEEVKQ